MLPFSYDFKCGQSQLTGELYTETGMFAGGSERTRTVTTTKGNNSDTKTYTHTDINVRLPSGKVRSVTKDGSTNIPSSTAITLFYHQQGDRYKPFHIYIHDTDQMYRLGKKDERTARRSIFGWGISRRLWARLIDGVTIVAGAGLGVLAWIFVSQNLDWGDFMGFFAFLIGTALAITGLSYPAQWLGGGFYPYQSFETEIGSVTIERAKALDKQLNQGQDNVDVSAAEGLITEGATTNESPDFKPMF